jgi:deoxyribodipyrimidine photo-lyase
MTMQSEVELRLHGQGAATRGDFVLYWMQVTLRAHHNQAFNYAVERSNMLGLPVLVYHGLRSDYPWASDRIHTFVLESAVDLAEDFEGMGVQYVFYLERDRDPSRPSPLVALSRRAALVVTDFFPTFIVSRQTAKLRHHLRGGGPPVVAVDSSTVVPMAALGRGFTSARAIRPTLERALSHFLHPVGTAAPRWQRAVEVPFEPERVACGETITTLVRSCAIDHGVAPSLSIRGGPRAARTRLARFLDTGISRYLEDRNDPVNDSSSGLSPYLHFGNISPQEILLRAREAGSDPDYGAFQDQLLTWRELAYNFACHDPCHDSPDAIPAWARHELEEHSADARPVIYDDSQLEAAKTGDDLWNAAQRSYLREGYMHNYMRMLWGKAVLLWTADYLHAFRILVHLNNKYALDGRDPNSYAGIQWIFGKFDRPFYRRPIFGTVRYMSLKAAGKKFDAARYVEGSRELTPAL